MIFRSKRKTAYVDLDGVLIDCVGPAMAVNGVPGFREEDYPPECGFDLVKVCNVFRKRLAMSRLTPEQFWRRTSETFWATLPFMPMALEFLDELYDVVGQENVCIATATIPSKYTSAAIAGKQRWLDSHLPGVPYFIGLDKSFLANRDTILIDDANHNCGDFARAGGTAILVRRPWNRGGYQQVNPLIAAMNDVRQLCG
jgi:hypothetical protein